MHATYLSSKQTTFSTYSVVKIWKYITYIQSSFNCIFSMPYVEAVVLESIRMFMGRAFGVPHRALKDTTLAGFFIPKVSVYYIIKLTVF